MDYERAVDPRSKHIGLGGSGILIRNMSWPAHLSRMESPGKSPLPSHTFAVASLASYNTKKIRAIF